MKKNKKIKTNTN